MVQRNIHFQILLEENDALCFISSCIPAFSSLPNTGILSDSSLGKPAFMQSLLGKGLPGIQTLKIWENWLGRWPRRAERGKESYTLVTQVTFCQAQGSQNVKHLYCKGCYWWRVSQGCGSRGSQCIRMEETRVTRFEKNNLSAFLVATSSFSGGLQSSLDGSKKSRKIPFPKCTGPLIRDHYLGSGSAMMLDVGWGLGSSWDAKG